MNTVTKEKMNKLYLYTQVGKPTFSSKEWAYSILFDYILNIIKEPQAVDKSIFNSDGST